MKNSIRKKRRIREETGMRRSRLVIAIRLFMGAVFIGCMLLGIFLDTPELRSYFFMSAFTSLVTVVLTFVPAFLMNRMHIIVPASLEAFFVVFILLAEFFGEILNFYDVFWWWDIMLHTSSGVMLGLMGVLVVYSLNLKNGAIYNMHPMTIMLFSFCFALACGAIWEIFEFSGDYLLGMNMQKSVYVMNGAGTEQFSGEALEYFNENVRFFSNLGGGKAGRVFDPGLMDTMEDFIVDTMGAIVSVVLTNLYMNRHRKRFIAERDGTEVDASNTAGADDAVVAAGALNSAGE